MQIQTLSFDVFLFCKAQSKLGMACLILGSSAGNSLCCSLKFISKQLSLPRQIPVFYYDVVGKIKEVNEGTKSENQHKILPEGNGEVSWLTPFCVCCADKHDGSCT
jgi:hypothetical protein